MGEQTARPVAGHVTRQSKATLFRSYVVVLRREGILAQVLERVPPATRALLDDPPPASAWVDSMHTEHVAVAVTDLVGADAWRRIVHDATLAGLVPVLRVAIEGFLRLFGASPASILSRMGQLTANSVRGVDYEYTPVTARSGELVMIQLGRFDAPIALFQGAAGGIAVVFDLCRVRGTISEPEPVSDPRGSAVRYRVSW